MVPRPAAWSASRNWGIVIDAGSSGSRVQVYSWLEPEVARQLKKANGETVNVLSKVEKGVESGEGWHMKVEPGISTFGSTPQAVGDYLKPLIEFASSVIPAKAHSSTPIYLLATAGMRLLPPNEQQDVLLTACVYLQSFDFLLPDCSENVRIISGEEEGLYGWIAVNYLMDGFDSHTHAAGESDSSTYGFLDMGGASTQIAFEPSPTERVKHADNLLEVRLRLLSGRDVVHPVFVTTWLGYGTNQARERYIAQEVRKHHDEGITGNIIDDPCLPKSLMLSSERHTGVTLRGTGDFLSCVRKTGPLLNKEVECLDEPCLFNGVHVPRIDFDVNHFIGISEYWYSTQEVWAMGGMYDFVAFERNARAYCAREWSDIISDHQRGDGGWRKDVELARLESQCFKAAWVINILHEGIGIPRLHLDSGGKGDGEDVMSKGVKKAKEKGVLQKTPPLTKQPSFQSVQSVGDVAVSWTLGKMVLEVSRSSPSSPFSVTPSKSWRSWRPSTISANTHAVPLSLFAFIMFALFVLLSPRRRHALLSGVVKHRTRSDFSGLEGNLSASGLERASDSTSLISSLLSTVRNALQRLSNLSHRRLSPRSASYTSLPTSGSLLPTSVSRPHPPPQPPPPPLLSSSSYSIAAQTPPTLRTAKSTPFLLRPTATTPTPQQQQQHTATPTAHHAGSGKTIGAYSVGHWNDVPDNVFFTSASSSSASTTSRPTTPASGFRTIGPGAGSGSMTKRRETASVPLPLTLLGDDGVTANGVIGAVGSADLSGGRRSAPSTPPPGNWS